MKNRSGIALSFLSAVLVVTACSSATLPRESSLLDRQPLVVFLVRHAEKVDESRDPDLSAAGRERAATLASVLRDAAIGQVHSSDYARTRETALPSAKAQGLGISLYDPRDLPALARKLRGAGGRHLVVGHSNTTVEVVELLGGDAGPPIIEAGEYDRLYSVTVVPGGLTSTVLMRYGKPYNPGHQHPARPAAASEPTGKAIP